MQAYLPSHAFIFVATEVLKNPFMALEQTTEILVKAVHEAAALPVGLDTDFWLCLKALREAQPWLPLSRPWQPAAVVVGEFKQLLQGGRQGFHMAEASE
jgi:hypothetical protein